MLEVPHLNAVSSDLIVLFHCSVRSDEDAPLDEGEPKPRKNLPPGRLASKAAWSTHRCVSLIQTEMLRAWWTV